jgi:phosphoribosyl-AMP cyclohydrolase
MSENNTVITTDWLEHIRWDDKGLLPVIAQESSSGQVLMFAWMNREALQLTAQHRRAVYWSRSRNKLWFKGEESGHVQHVDDIRLDCDQDVLLLKVRQDGGIACHTGRHHCFFERLETTSAELGVEVGTVPSVMQWTVVEPVLQDPTTIYSKP